MNTLRNIFTSFKWAFQGFVLAVKHERNFRIDLAAGLFALVFGFVYGLNGMEYSILALMVLLVPACELFNTAIEEMVDKTSPEKNIHAKFAKDTAAAGVLLVAVASIIVAVCLFLLDLQRFWATIVTLFTTWWLIFIVIYIPLAILFIIGRKSWRKRSLHHIEKEKKEEE